LILANCIAFSLTVDDRLQLREGALLQGGFTPSPFFHGERMESVLTHMFLHAEAYHLLSNMLALLWLGSALESRIGSGRFLLVYLGCGILAALIFGMLDPGSTIPAVGASAAIFGLMGNLALLYPTSFVIVLVIPVPVVLVAILYAFAMISVIQSGYAGPIGHIAHLAGMASGMGLAFLMDPEDALKGLGIFTLCFVAIVVMMQLL
jgi:membrane associated rhomboid family serine protease